MDWPIADDLLDEEFAPLDRRRNFADTIGDRIRDRDLCSPARGHFPKLGSRDRAAGRELLEDVQVSACRQPKLLRRPTAVEGREAIDLCRLQSPLERRRADQHVGQRVSILIQHLNGHVMRRELHAAQRDLPTVDRLECVRDKTRIPISRPRNARAIDKLLTSVRPAEHNRYGGPIERVLDERQVRFAISVDVTKLRRWHTERRMIDDESRLQCDGRQIGKIDGAEQQITGPRAANQEVVVRVAVEVADSSHASQAVTRRTPLKTEGVCIHIVDRARLQRDTGTNHRK